MSTVGYDMYLKLIEQAVSEAQGVEVTRAGQPAWAGRGRLPAEERATCRREKLRVEIYKRIAMIQDEAGRMDIEEELIDRFWRCARAGGEPHAHCPAARGDAQAGREPPVPAARRHSYAHRHPLPARPPAVCFDAMSPRRRTPALFPPGARRSWCWPSAAWTRPPR